jgi:hypothetical protein
MFRQNASFPYFLGLFSIWNYSVRSYTKGLSFLSVRNAKPKIPCIGGGEGTIAISKEAQSYKCHKRD